MKKRTRDEWRELFKQQADGHLSVVAFCKAHSIGQSYFYKRKSDLTVKNNQPIKTRFIKVKMTKVPVTQNTPQNNCFTIKEIPVIPTLWRDLK